jgi:hypothetical protein
MTNKELIVKTLQLIEGIATKPGWAAAGEHIELAPSTLTQVRDALAAAEASNMELFEATICPVVMPSARFE